MCPGCCRGLARGCLCPSSGAQGRLQADDLGAQRWAFPSSPRCLQEVFQSLYRTRSFLFVGCGETLRDQIFQALFLYSVPNKVELEHYMVVLKESEDLFFKHQADMLLHGIKVVSYGACFDHFPGYVQDLATQICRQRSPGTAFSPREPGRPRCPFLRRNPHATNIMEAFEFFFYMPLNSPALEFPQLSPSVWRTG